ncbi:tRNA glutamyl-Q(34) synthetase GluQRS [Motilimonas pumila]|uniref:Glutamyl-Q tRNA(Asp) synthetase n=1 Tax=Motilimonas pumila TaxID=2303987 RepID=A0A418YC22_9GAMM|nr:tRNA glutamyl-Q(34) synthetase GluQRS [Motilimonas pumila]RJG42075.1 tRNA glutamyl-Q(34) synthetase GluQRS [Motilimonas pumila]
MTRSPHYIGRFAPSPSGELHFGSLLAALGSYLQAHHQGGHWLVRMEDIDPPREVAGAADSILATLERFGLNWHGTVMYQSQQNERYQATLEQLRQQGLTYACRCTRAQIKQAGGFYQGHCQSLNLPVEQSAIRLRTTQPVYQFDDLLQGVTRIPKALAEEDFIIHRKDGLYAYNLAVTLDDIAQGITQVVRGADLLVPTGRQIALMQQLSANVPEYVHLPLAVTAPGMKLSKQNHAPSIAQQDIMQTTWHALSFLGQLPPALSEFAHQSDLLAWAITNWQLDKVANKTEQIWVS